MEEVSIREKHEFLENLVSLRRSDYTTYIAVIYIIVSMLIDDGKITAEEAVLKDEDLATASKGELKRAIKCLRETAAGDLKIANPLNAPFSISAKTYSTRRKEHRE